MHLPCTCTPAPLHPCTLAPLHPCTPAPCTPAPLHLCPVYSPRVRRERCRLSGWSGRHLPDRFDPRCIVEPDSPPARKLPFRRRPVARRRARHAGPDRAVQRDRHRHIRPRHPPHVRRARVIALAHRVQERRDAQATAEGRGHRPSTLAEVLHFLGEVEVVFGLWAVVLLVAITLLRGWDAADALLQRHRQLHRAAVRRRDHGARLDPAGDRLRRSGAARVARARRRHAGGVVGRRSSPSARCSARSSPSRRR